MPFVTANGVELYYVERGPSASEAAYTAVFLHGFTIDHRSNLAAFDDCFGSRPQWRRLYLDFPGMGRTVAPEWLASTDDVFAVTRAAVDDLVPGRYAAIGGSFGGYIALGFAAAAPARVTGVMLYVPMVVPEHAERRVPAKQVLVNDPALPRGSEDFEDMAVVRTAQTQRRTSAEIDPAVEIADEAAVDRIFARYGGSFPITPASGSFDAPTLVLTGRQDDVVGFDDQLAHLGGWPRTTFVVLDRAGHNLQIEQPTLVSALFSEWLDRVAEAAGG